MNARNAAGVMEQDEMHGGGERPRDAVFREAIENAPVSIAFVNRDGSYRYANGACCAMLGLSLEELVGRSISSLTMAEESQAAADKLEQLWRGEIQDLDVQRRYRRKDGTTLWLRVNASLAWGGGEEPDCAVELWRGVLRDKDAAEALQNHTLLSTLIDELPLALLACDATGRMTHFNRAAGDLFSVPNPEGFVVGEDAKGLVIGESSIAVPRVFHADGATRVSRKDLPLFRALNGEVVRDEDLIAVRPDGRARATRASARRLVTPTGEVVGAVGIVQDITEQQAAAEALEKAHKELLIASRQAGMAEIATNVLHNVGNVLNSVNVSASLAAERIGKSKSTGVSRVAALLDQHSADLPAFFSSDRGRHLPVFLKELASELAGEREAVMAELTTLRSHIEHIKEIVAMQQTYAKRLGVSDTLDIRSLVEDSLRMNEGAFGRHGVTLTRDFADVPPITVDKHKVLQILVNVIRNAKYACDEGHGGEKRVTVRVRSQAGSVSVSVIDTGIGIPKENLERIFNCGFTTRKDGHGFGLHSSALAAKELGGSFWAESAGPGQGATFTLTLPITPESGSVQ